MSTTALADTALAFARRGWPVYPLADQSKAPRSNCEPCRPEHCDHPPQECPCHGRTATCHAQYAATTNPALVEHWWRKWPHANIGVNTQRAGLVVVDLDITTDPPPPRWASIPGVTDGWDVLAVRAEQAEQPLPFDTVMVATPSGGCHLWYSYTGPPIPSRAHGIGWKVDTRAAGGSAIAPPSVTRRGAYTHISGATPAPLPSWFANLAVPPPPPTRRTGRQLPPPANRGERYAAAALASAVAIVRDSGTRNVDLNAQAYSIGQLVGAGLIPHEHAEEILIDAVADAGLPNREATYTTRRALTQGARKPRQLDEGGR